MVVSRKKELSLSVRPGPEADVPFTPEQLLELGAKYVSLKGIRKDLREDAAQEFAIAAWNAVAKAEKMENIRAFQSRAGKWAVANFLKQERRRSNNETSYKESLCNGREQNGFFDSVSTIDESATDPLQALIVKEDSELAMACFKELSEREREVIEAVVFDELSFRKTGERFGFSKNYARQIYLEAIEKLRIRMASIPAKPIRP